MNSRKASRELDAVSQAAIEKALSKDINDLTKEDVAFLIARSDYLDKEEIKAIKGTNAYKEFVKDQEAKAKAEVGQE